MQTEIQNNHLHSVGAELLPNQLSFLRCVDEGTEQACMKFARTATTVLVNSWPRYRGATDI